MTGTTEEGTTQPHGNDPISERAGLSGEVATTGWLISPQGNAAWPETVSPLERAATQMAAWSVSNPHLLQRARLLRNTLLSISSRAAGTLLVILAGTGMLSMGVAAATHRPIAASQVAAVAILWVLWLGNRKLRRRWQARGIYTAKPKRRPRGRALWAGRQPRQRASSEALEPTRRVRLKRP